MGEVTRQIVEGGEYPAATTSGDHRAIDQRESDVLVVGAGPVGLTMACELLRRGVSCRIIDRADAPSQTSKALGIQPRTLEIFENMGIVGELVARGMRITGANVYHGGRPLLRLDTRHLHLKMPYPYVLALPQSETERLLTERLYALGGQIERSKELVGLGQERDRIVAFVKGAGDDRTGATEEISASWLVGCDGAHSRVRHTLGVPFEGSAYREEFLLADVDLDWDKGHAEARVWLHEDGPFLALPLPGDRQWRLIADATPAEGEEAPQASVELFQELIAERTGDTETRISNPTWLSNFRINRRMVAEYRRGRAFLMGDAAHIHSPVGGQGMNTGIQDAYNLGWKLALVIGGKVPASLLDTYEEERMPIARGVLRGTHTSTSLIVSRNPALRFLRDNVLTRLLSLPLVQETAFRKNAELNVNYRKSSLSRSYTGPSAARTLLSHLKAGETDLKDRLRLAVAPGAGDRAPQGCCLRYPSREETSLFKELGGTGFTLLLFAGLMRTGEGYEDLTEIARNVEDLLDQDVNAYVVVAGNDKPRDLSWDGPVLLDPEHALHRAYGAGSESLYLIRPDGYIGFRSRPVRGDQLLDYLGDLFLLDGAANEAAKTLSS